MRCLATFICVLIFYFGSIAHLASQIRIGAKAGLNLANQEWNGVGGNVENKILPTYLVGGIVEFDLRGNFGIGSGLELQGKGTQVEFFKTYINYLEIPVQLQYRNNGYFGAIGPYFSYALGGKYKQSSGDDIKLSFGSSTKDDFSATDFGINLEFGYEFTQLRATVLYSHGISNNIPLDSHSQFHGGSINSTVIGLALTYLFGEY